MQPSILAQTSGIWPEIAVLEQRLFVEREKITRGGGDAFSIQGFEKSFARQAENFRVVAKEVEVMGVAGGTIGVNKGNEIRDFSLAQEACIWFGDGCARTVGY